MGSEEWMTEKPKYAFHWGLLGNLDEGRPNLGKFTRLEVYRLMQFTFRDVLERHYGTLVADKVFYEAGQMAGKAFYEKMLGKVDQFDQFVRRLQEVLREMGIGILRIEKADLEKGIFVLTVSEDLDCSGLPELDYEICVYDEGFISGIMESFSGRKFTVKEIDCWCSGDRTCRFQAQAVD
jgi:predicted hydrocarbon binding protein